MACVQVNPGICGLTSALEVALGDDGMCEFKGESTCPHVQALVEGLAGIDPYGEISFAGEGPRILAAAQELLPHPACPVPCALLKAVEVTAGLALPADVTVSVSA